MHRIRRTALLVAALSLSACGGDDATGPEGGLTDAEAAVLAEVILDLTLDNSTVEAGAAAADTPAGASGPAAAPRHFDLDLSFGAPCALGGVLEVDLEISGTLDDETGAGDLTFSMAQTPVACMVRHEASGRTFTLDGAPSVTSAVELVSDGGSTLEITGDYGGAVAWATDGRSGTCTLDLSFTGQVDALAESGSGTMRGTVCGVEVEQAWAS